MSCLVVGGVLAALTNLLYADLAVGSPRLDAFLGATGLDGVYAVFGADARMARLLTAIAAENLAGGFASAVFVAYLSSIVNPRHAAVQFALLASLTMLLGALGRGALGEMIEVRGYAEVFILTMWLGLFAAGVCALEWLRRAVFSTGGNQPGAAG
jgi:PAT family beta-lactamase induction signal transducer AmpG